MERTTKGINKYERETNRKLAARIEQRIAEGWSLEKIGDRTVWHMFGHLYSIKGNVLRVKMAGGDQEFTALAVVR